MAKSAADRIRDVLAFGKQHGNAAVVKLFTCIERNVEHSEASLAKEALGKALSLGWYTGETAEKKAQRQAVRACLLLQLTVGGMRTSTTAFKNERTRLMAMTRNNLLAEMVTLQGQAPAAHLSMVVTTRWEDDSKSADGIVHHLGFTSSTASNFHLAHIATRELVVYERILLDGSADLDIDLYGGPKKWDVKAHWPWFPNAPKYGEAVSPPNPTLMGPYANGLAGGGKDTHSFGPHGATTMTDVGVLSPRLRECVLVAKQVYQYNDTGDPDTWTRDDKRDPDTVSVVHPNDAHWKPILGSGKWLIQRKLFQSEDSIWRMTTTKVGNQASNQHDSYERTQTITGDV